MSEETSAVSFSGETDSNAFARDFISRKMLDMQKELTGFIEQYVLYLIERISNLEQELGHENIRRVPADSEEGSLLLKLEAMTLDKKSRPEGSTADAGKQSGLKQQVSDLQDELRKTNARVEELEILLNKTNASRNEASVRNLVKLELDAVLEGKVESCVIKNLGKPVQQISADDTQKTNLRRGISESKTLIPWTREKLHDKAEENRVRDEYSDRGTARHDPSDLYQEDMKSRQDKVGTLREGVRGDYQPKSFDGMLEENLQETRVHGVPSPISNRNGKQPPSLEGRVEQSGRMQPTISTRTLDEPMSLEGMLEVDKSGNTHIGTHPTVSSRTLDQPLSLEGLLEGDTSENIPGDMQPAISSRTLVNQPMSLEGQLEGDTRGNTHVGINPAVSTRTVDQPMSLEGLLEGDTSENIPSDMQPAISSRTIDQPMSLEGMLEGTTLEAASEVKPPIPQKPSAQKVHSKPFGFLQKKLKKGSKVPDAGDPDKPHGLETGLSGASKVKGKKS